MCLSEIVSSLGHLEPLQCVLVKLAHVPGFGSAYTRSDSLSCGPPCSVTYTGNAQTKNVLTEKEKKEKKKKKKKEKRTGPFCRDCAALAGRSLKILL